MSLHITVDWRRGDFSLRCQVDLETDGVTALFGRSGCGKTSLLRVVAGLERIPDARVRFRGVDWQSDRDFVRPEQRCIGLVFQEHSLLPHLDVKDNLLYGWRRMPAAQRRVALQNVLELLEIGNLLERRIHQLSGGQRQRVALGRALLRSPDLLLLDEPLAALDTQAKREILPFLDRLARESEVPMLLVTHAPDEVQRLADRVVFISDGRVDEICSLQKAMTRADSPLFTDDGPASILQGVLSSVDEYESQVFETGGGVRLFLQMTDSSSVSSRVRIKARDVSLALDDPARISIRNHLPVVIERLDELPGQRVLVSVRLKDGQVLMSEITPWSAQQLQLRPGMPVWALIKSAALV